VIETTCATSAGAALTPKDSPLWLTARDIQATEVEEYHDAVDALEIEAIRRGSGGNPSRVRSLTAPGISVTALDTGFEKMVRTVVPAESLAVALVAKAPEGCRWRGGELALHPGLVATYHPGAEHTGLNLPGFAFTFAVVDTESVMARAAELEVTLEQPERGLVEMPPNTPRTQRAVELLKLIRAQTNQSTVPARVMDDLLTSVTLMRANPGSNVHSPRLGKVNSWEVVTRCIEYAEATRRVPAIHELCLVGQVGESRLRQAFHDVYDISPVRFFRDWALTEAHHRLQLAEPGERSVTKIASDIGLTHLGRFAVQYRELFGECPSKTLAHTRA
jgi:AraC family ethanolamine operon transcriptional activator